MSIVKPDPIAPCYGCNGASEKKSKSECDSKFYQDMLSECAKLKEGSYWRNNCEGNAITYYNKVVKKGQPYFDTGRKDCCKKKCTSPEIDTPKG